MHFEWLASDWLFPPRGKLMGEPSQNFVKQAGSCSTHSIPEQELARHVDIAKFKGEQAKRTHLIPLFGTT